MVKIGTHNSMTYLPPRRWYMHPFRFMAKCQSVNLKEQYKLGARMFDLRIRFDKNGKPYFCHGLISFKGDVEQALQFLNKRRATVRLILEKNTENPYQDSLFVEFCSRVKEQYNKVKFFGGVRKGDWKTLYDFGFYPEYIDKYASNNQPGPNYTGTVLDDLWPWIYAKLNNRKNFENRDESKHLLIDFIDLLKDQLNPVK